ncbi:MAG: hypothetical protein P9M08_01410 [Candidatus Erginobacter occultus]|nr:hypothetical protein [Candidatus Erginobacter occultus]
MASIRRFVLILFGSGLLLSPAAAGAADVFQWGRIQEGRRSFDLEVTGGKVTLIKGSVEETIRPYYEQIGQDTPGESFTLAELGLDGKKATFGLRMEKRWKYFTLSLGGFYYNPAADTTAIRDYYLGISNDIEFQGREYEYMLIPEGQPFTADLKTAFCELSLLVTPVTIAPLPNFEFIPVFYLGVSGAFGTYDLDAGPPTGTVIYENPPREYVVGGQTDGWTGIGVPAIGIGGELRIGPPDGLRLMARAHYKFFRYDGSTEYLPISIRHEKNLDLDYDSVEARVQLELPLSRKLDLFAGVAYGYFKIDAETTATEKSPEDIEELREKYDKKINFEMADLKGFVGLKF